MRMVIQSVALAVYFTAGAAGILPARLLRL
jgi:hypothetical protein